MQRQVFSVNPLFIFPCFINLGKNCTYFGYFNFFMDKEKKYVFHCSRDATMIECNIAAFLATKRWLPLQQSSHPNIAVHESRYRQNVKKKKIQLRRLDFFFASVTRNKLDTFRHKVFQYFTCKFCVLHGCGPLTHQNGLFNGVSFMLLSQ